MTGPTGGGSSICCWPPGSRAAGCAWSCSGSTETVKFFFVGENQYGDWGGSQYWEIAPKGCTTASGYWWKAGQSVAFHHRKPSTGWRWEPRIISYNDTENGAVYDLWIG